MRRAVGPLVSACLLLAAGLVSAPPAGAAVITPVGGLASATSGIAVGSDGNLWVAEQFAGSVAKVSPSGTVLGRVNLGGDPTQVASGPDGTIWVTNPSLSRVSRIAVVDSSHIDIDVSALAACGPIAVANGGDGFMYLSFPCSPTPKLGRIPVNAGPGAGSVTGRGTVYDLLVAGGRLYAPDFDGDVIRAMNLDPTLTVTSTVNASAGSQPDGIATAGGRIYVSSFAGAGVATFPANPADNSSATMLSPPSPFAGSYGITPNGSGGVIATGKDTANYAYVDAAGTVTTTSLPAGFEPFDAVTAPNGDVWLTDQAHTQIIHVVDGPPTATASAPKGTSSTTAELGFSVDTHGNDTSWTVEYGTNTAYGKSVGATIAGGGGPVARNVTLPKLKGGKTYHLRLVATNARGTYTGPDVVLTMPKFAPGKPAFKSKVSKAGTQLTSVKIAKLAVGEKVTLSCSGKGCPLKKKVFKIKKKGILDLTAIFRGKVLKPGAKVVVKLSAKKVAASTTTLTVRPGKAPVVTLGRTSG